MKTLDVWNTREEGREENEIGEDHSGNSNCIYNA